MINDVHAHPFSRRQPKPGESAAKAGAEFVDKSDELVADMDRNGVAMAAALYGRCSNAEIQAVVRKHPKRFVAFCGWWHPDDRKTSPAETIEKCLKAPEFKGVGEVHLDIFEKHGTPEPHPEMDMARLREVMDVVSHFKAPILICTGFFHTAPGGEARPLAWKDPFVVDRIALDYPDTPIIIGHSGGLYPPFNDHALLVAYSHENIFLDTSKTTSATIEKAVTQIGASRLVFGSDWTGGKVLTHGPTASRECHLYSRNVRVVQEARIPERDKDLILYENLKQLLRLPL